MEERIKSGVFEKYYYQKLDNGLDVYLFPNLNVDSFYITYSTKFGASTTEFKGKKESKYHKVPQGTAHFLEHQMFQEDDMSSAYEYFTKLGSSANAFTSQDVTCYEVFGNTNFKENLECLLDYVNNPCFTSKGVKKEKGIIEEEIKMCENNPNIAIFNIMNNMLLTNDNHRYLVTGTVDDIKKITEDDLKLCYEYFYNPNNMFIIITGKFNRFEALSIIKENMSKREFIKYKYPVSKKKKELDQVNNKYQEVEMNVLIPKVHVSYKINNKVFSDLKLNNFLLECYLKIILSAKFSNTSDLSYFLIENELTNNALSPSIRVYKSYTTIGIVAVTPYTEEVIKILDENLNNMEITEEEFNRKIKVYLSEYILSFDNIENTNNEIQDDIIYNNECIDNYYDILKSLKYEIALEIIKLINNKHKSILKIIPYKN